MIARICIRASSDRGRPRRQGDGSGRAVLRGVEITKQPRPKRFADHRGADRFNDSVIRDTVIRMTRIDVHGIWAGIWAGICAEETTEKRQRTDAAGCCSIWQTLDSIRRRPTRPTRGGGWRRMESMLERVLAKLD